MLFFYLNDILKKLGYNKTTVLCTYGRITEIAGGSGAYGSGIYPEKNFDTDMVILPERKKVVDEIIAQASYAEHVYIGTNQDREGELLGWTAIKVCELAPEKCFRLVLPEITPEAVNEALAQAKPFSAHQAQAAFVRTIIDKLLGYSLSSFAKKYLGAKSIGRYQAVGLQILAERERKIENHIPDLHYELCLDFIKDDLKIRAKYLENNEAKVQKFTNKADVEMIMLNCKNIQYCYIENIKKSIDIFC